MRPLILALLLSMLPLAGAAQGDIPERRLVLTQDTDFPGSDLQSLFDTTYQACERACLAQSACVGFTFNSRSNACFPKSAITGREPYVGAWSGEVIVATSEARGLAATRAGEIAFLRSYALSRAREQAQAIGALHPSGQWTLDQLLAFAADSRAAGDLLRAMRWMGGAVAQSDAGAQWTEYARLALQLATFGGDDASMLRERGFHAAINGYLRSEADAERATALVVLAEALEANERGADMIPTLRLAEGLGPRADVTEALDRALDLYGFRLLESRVENDLADPRLCADFSEPLAKGVDYAPFVRVPDLTMTVEAAGSTLCIAGVDHGARYQVTFRTGLPSAAGEVTRREVTQTLYVRDRSPRVTFPGRAYVLPRGADPALPVETVNLTALDLELFAVSDRNVVQAVRDGLFGRNIDAWEVDRFRSDLAEPVWQGTASVTQELNRDVLTRLPLADALSDRGPGLYVLSATVPGADSYDVAPATQWFVLSNLGLSTLSGTDGVHVFVRALSDGRAREGVTVTLLNRANAVLATDNTDADGHVLFPTGITRGTGAAAPAMVMVEDGTTDAAFLSLTDPAFDLSDRGVEGAEPAPAIDVFVATDRGAYRVGETVHATLLTRDSRAEAITGLPLTAVVKRPDGVEYARQVLTDVAGGYVLAQPIGAAAPRGTWRLEVFADPSAPALSARTFLVEDFLPERIDVTLSLAEGVLSRTAPAALTLDARYLFGAPGAGLKYEGDVILRAARGLPGYAGWTFGLHDERVSPVVDAIPAGVTDAQGRAALSVGYPATGPVDRPLEAEMVLRVAEGSARPVERRITRVLAPTAPVIGIRPGFDGVVAEGGMADLSLIALGPDLAPVDMPVRWTLQRVETRYQWYQSYGSWNWEPVTRRVAVAQGTATLRAAPVAVSARVEWGQYELLVEGQVEGRGVAASTSFYAGWYAPADVSATPDTLELSLDRPAYRPGDTAVLRLVPRAAGTAVVQVLSNRLIAMQTVAVSEGENIIRLPVTDDWGSGAYVTATVIAGTDVAAARNPTRALGLAHAAVDPGPRALQVAFDAPTEADPRGTLTAAVTVAGVAPGETAHVTVAAVDVGILNLTGFASPDPSAHYFGQRRLGVEMRDIYGRLIDGMNGALGQVRSGGDSGAAMRLQSPPPTEDLLAYFSGPVTVGPDGRAEVAFDLPAFNGTVRLMAVAWSPTGVGQASADVLVRDPVVVTASLPRHLAPGDTSRVLLEVVHATGPAGRMGLDVTAGGVSLGAVPSGVDLDPLGKVALVVPVTAGAAGDHVIRVALTTPDGRQLVKDLRMPVRRLDPELADTRRFTLAAGDTFTLDGNVFAGLAEGNAVLTAGPLAQINAPAILAQLDRYPYGCTEQITSQALPLLSFAPLADALELGDAAQVRLRVDQAIGRILARQGSNGGFGLWQADGGDLWLEAYVSDFLSRARAAAYGVPDLAFVQAMDNLRNRVNSYGDFEAGGEDLAYALMVLAREGAASMGDLRYYADARADAFATPLAAAQLGAALAFYGDPVRADAMFARAARMLADQSDDEADQTWRADYGSHLRDAAGVLALAVEAGSQAVDRDALASRIAGAGRTLSTQESAWSLMAARGLVTDPGLAGITFDGVARDLPLVRVTAAEATVPVAVRNTRATPVDITLTTLGVPDVAPAASGYGYAITRAYFTPDGVAVPDLAQVAQGTRLIVVLTVQPFEDGGARLMINDPLPAGFEIDNPALVRSGDVAGLDWLVTSDTQMAEFRTERFLAAVDQQGSETVQLAYVVRAISPGTFHHAAATVEDMYRPQYRAWTDTGAVIVVE